MCTSAIRTSILSLLVLCAVALAATPALAQDRVYEEGSVWEVSYVRTEPGQFDNYLTNLSQVWKKVMDRAVENGDVLSYKMIAGQATHAGDWDLLLLTEFPNMATFDGMQDRMDPIVEEVIGSMRAVSDATVERRKLREMLGTKLAREITFKE